MAELFLGLPLFPGASEYDLLKRMMEILRYVLHYYSCFIIHLGKIRSYNKKGIVTSVR